MLSRFTLERNPTLTELTARQKPKNLNFIYGYVNRLRLATCMLVGTQLRKGSSLH